MKKEKAILMVGIALISVFVLAVPAIAQENNVISIGDIEVSPSGSVTTPILIHNATSVATVRINLSYDQSVVNVTNAEKVDFDDWFGFDNTHASDGYVIIAAVKFGELSGDRTVANVELTATGSAGMSSNLNLSIIELSDSGGNPIEGSTSNGSFTIQETTPPILENPRAEPLIIPDDTDGVPLWGENTTLSVNVTDETAISTVTINLSAIGGSPITNMSNIGNYTDGTLWCLFNHTTNASNGTAGWNGSAYVPYCLPVNATDIHGNSNTSVCINLTVMKNGDVTGDGKVMMGDGVRIVNHVFNLEDPKYSLPSDTIADVTGDDKVMMGDGVRIVNHVFNPEDPKYLLK